MADLNRKSDSTSTSEVLPPEIKIIQGTTRDAPEGAKVGQFCNVISGEVFDSFEFIYVDRDKTRTYWGRETIEDDPPVCWSPDADTYQSADGKDCKKCQYRLDNAASVSADVRRQKCCIHYTLKGIKVPGWEPFMMRITGVSTGEFMRLMSFFLYNPTIRDKKTGKPEYHTIIVPVKAEQVKSPAGMSYGLKFGAFKPIKEPELITAALSISAELLGQLDKLLLPEGQEEDTPEIPQAEKDAAKLYEGNKEPLPANTPKINVISSEPKKVLVGYLEDGKEIYVGDLVPAGARVLHEKPAAPTAAKPSTPTAPATKPTSKPSNIDISSL